MRLLRTALATVLTNLFWVSLLSAERYQLQNNRPTADSLAIQEIRSQVNEEARLNSLRQFTAVFPDSPSIGWAYEQMHGILQRTGAWEEAFRVGEKLLALDPEDLEAAFRNVQIAEKRQDPALVRTHADRAVEAARRVLSKNGSPAAASDLARQILNYAEYLEFVEISQTADPRQRLAKMDRFGQAYPKSAYTATLESLYFSTYEQTGERGKALAFAEKIVQTKASDNEDLLISIAEHYFGRDSEPDKVIQYCTRALDVLRQKQRPEEISEADWARKAARLGMRANWMLGKLYMDRGNFSASDRHLRAALPLVRGNDAMTAAVLFHAGWVAYKLGNLADAEKFNQSCMLYKGRYQAQAARNLEVIRVERSAK
jgi:tetratricopeptide (TPR) repeat protein